MRDQPLFVHGIASEASAQMVVNAALAHLVEGEFHGAAEWLGPAPLPGPPEQLHDRGLRKLGRRADAAVKGIDLPREAFGDPIEQVERDGAASLVRGEIFKGLAQGAYVLGDILRRLLIGIRDPVQDLDEAGSAVARLGRKVGAAPKGLAVGGEEHGKRPTALFRHERQRGLIDGVQIGALLAVHLDAHEEFVHDPRDLFVLEGFVRHDVAPVAGGIADRKQDRLFLALGLGEGLRTPGMPVNRIVLVLQEVGAGFAAQAVAGGGARTGVRTSLGVALGFRGGALVRHVEMGLLAWPLDPIATGRCGRGVLTYSVA